MSEAAPDSDEIKALNAALRRVIFSVRTSQAPANVLQAAREPQIFFVLEMFALDR